MALSSTGDVYLLDGTRQLTREVVGGKAYSLNRMSALGLPVPPAFAIGVDVCPAYHEAGGRVPEAVWADVLKHLAELERRTGRRFGDPGAPLLVAVRSGAARSMPGMMDTVLNLGLTEPLRDALAEQSGNREWAEDTWRRFVRSYTDTVGTAPPADPVEQLRAAVGAVFQSWFSERAVAYRERHGIDDLVGTAVTVQAMVFGNLDDDSGTGVLFSRDPNTGEPGLFGEWLARAQGEDVVSGERTPQPLAALAETQPDNHAELVRIARVLEEDHRDMVDVEFTVESGKLYVLQARAGKRTPLAAARIAVDMAEEGLIDRRTALTRITPEQARRLEEQGGVTAGGEQLAKGLGASPGVGGGIAVTDTEEALRLSGEGKAVVLVRPATSPEDVPAMFASSAVVTEHGGSTSHAALVCREIGLPCVVGCGDGTMRELAGRAITVDGTAGVVLAGLVDTEQSGAEHEAVRTLASWAGELTGRTGPLSELLPDVVDAAPVKH
ncbi:pyruvate, phosphate dikinase [Thermomonospora sp. CIF 1]|uniref:pyruvate, phosphate dikinase n=1 Tax=Thermomonospora sp. CIF 1 TaxID=1916083 RepID=UPI000B1C1DF6|nr:pyruvate, phosphate dikinase [Thermomonospora sp. CIF 1]PKK14020.1 MAG: pyruvate, phosphate dikinase [Thermomonospora sp. CIF 1]